MNASDSARPPAIRREPDGDEERRYKPGKLAWANLSLSIAFIAGSFWSPGGLLMQAVIERPVLQTIPPSQSLALVALLNYCLVAVPIYVGLRSAGAERWLNFRPAISALLALGNALLIVYLAARIIASTVEGGGGSFVVLSASPVFVLPARALFLVGFVWLAVRSIRTKVSLPVVRRPMSVGEYVAILLVLGLPFAYASTLFIGEDAPLRLVKDARVRMTELCRSAGERTLLRPTVQVKGVFVQHDREDAFINIRDGVYEDSGNAGGSLGGGLINIGLLDFYEKPFGARTFDDAAEFKYRRFSRGDSRAYGTNDAKSFFGVFHKDLATQQDRKLGIRGTELSVVDLRTSDLLATSTFFVSTRDRRFCGNAQDGKFSTTEFVLRALALR